MVCIRNCSIALVFIISMIYMLFGFDKHKVVKDFMDSLSFNQKDKYNKLVNERRTLYAQGYGLGLLLTIVFLAWHYYYHTISKPYSQSSKMARSLVTKPLFVACMAVIISSFTTYFYYTLMPKTDYMILHLDDEKQRKLWLDVYKSMKWNYHISFVLGIGAVFFFSYL